MRGGLTLFAMSDGAWGLAGVVVVQLAGILALFVNSRRTRIDVKAINRAVNHQPEDAPTLVERVGSIEVRTEAIEVTTAVHRDWEHQAFSAIARQLGTTLPPYPEGDT